LTRESSKVLISCTSPDVYGSINHSDLVTTDENHRSFMKSISTNDRSEMKEINIEQASPNKTVEVLVPPSE
jgi:hypothetical protein